MFNLFRALRQALVRPIPQSVCFGNFGDTPLNSGPVCMDNYYEHIDAMYKNDDTKYFSTVFEVCVYAFNQDYSATLTMTPDRIWWVKFPNKDMYAKFLLTWS